MGLLERSQWKEWAQQWGLQHHPQRGWAVRNEWVVGAHKGYLARIGWRGNYGSELSVLIRFPKQEDLVRVRERVLRNPDLTGLPGWRKDKASGLQVDESSLLWTRSFPWSRPKTPTIQEWVERLIRALSEIVAPFDRRCEECRSSSVNEYVLLEDIPVYLCTTCQERLVAEAAMAERRYEQITANYGLGTVYGSLAAILGGGCWALLAVWTQRIYAAVAIGIAWLVAWSYSQGAKKIDRVGQVIGAGLTVAGVVLGDVSYYAFLVHERNPEIPFRLDVGWRVFVRVLQQRPGEVVISLLFGVLGVWFCFRFLRQPRFKPKIERRPSA